MSHLSKNSADDIIEYNRNIIYHMPKKYIHLDYYLNKGTLKRTLLKILSQIKRFKTVIIIEHKYCFFLDTNSLTHKVRKKASGRGTSNRHINLLCAIGLLHKEDPEKLQINANIMRDNPNMTMPVSLYSFRRYTDQELQQCDERAEGLISAGVTIGNISQTVLATHLHTEDLAREVFPRNSATAPQRKFREYDALVRVIEDLIDHQGYAYKSQVAYRMNGSVEVAVNKMAEVERLFKIFRSDLDERYYYKRPTKQQIEKWGLTNQKYIYTRKNEDINGN